MRCTCSGGISRITSSVTASTILMLSFWVSGLIEKRA